MASTPQNEEPGFEGDVNEVSNGSDSSSENLLEDGPASKSEQAAEMERVQEEAAEERKEGGYQ